MASRRDVLVDCRAGENDFMTGKKSYYVTDREERSRRVRELFNRIAPRYDLINDVQSLGLHRAWKRQLLRRAEPKPNERILDVCCGTGDITLALAKSGAEVTGVDFSGEMLKEARKRAADANELRFIEADALQLPFESEQFDLVTIAYGLRNLTHFDAGIEELVRVLKPGGRLFVLDFGKPNNTLWRRLYFAYLRWIVPLFGKVFCGDTAAYSYILDSLLHYPAQQGVAKRMGGLQMRDVGIQTFLGGVMAINYGRRPLPLSEKPVATS